MIVHLDTHVALWLAAGDRRRLRPVAKTLREGAAQISPMVVLEMEVLREIGRLKHPVDEILALLRDDHDITQATGDLGAIAARARLLRWTRDPFDRLITAHALSHHVTLLTADETIRANCPQAHWPA